MFGSAASRKSRNACGVAATNTGWLVDTRSVATPPGRWKATDRPRADRVRSQM